MLTRVQAYTGDSSIISIISITICEGEAPWALQHLGCGRQGARVSLSARFVSGARGAGLASSARRLAREWIKYRYGVFEELRGFPGDKLYR